MPLNPGNLTLTFSPPGRFTNDRLHKVPASTGLFPFTQAGCTIQSATVRDKIDDTAYAEATDKVFAPYNAATFAVAAEWYISWNGNNYRVIGVRHSPDAWGRLFQCDFIVKKEDG